MQHLVTHGRYVVLGLAGYWAGTAPLQATPELAWMRMYAAILLGAILLCTWPTPERKD